MAWLVQYVGWWLSGFLVGLTIGIVVGVVWQINASLP